jgi:hypothetical protein
VDAPSRASTILLANSPSRAASSEARSLSDLARRLLKTKAAKSSPFPMKYNAGAGLATNTTPCGLRPVSGAGIKLTEFIADIQED